MENIMARMETRPTRRGFCRAGFISRQEKRTQHYEKRIPSTVLRQPFPKKSRPALRPACYILYCFGLHTHPKRLGGMFLFIQVIGQIEVAFLVYIHPNGFTVLELAGQ